MSMPHASNITPVPRGWLKPSWIERFCLSSNADGTTALNTDAIDKPDLLQWVREHHVPQLTFSQFRTSLRRLCLGVLGPKSLTTALREDLRVLLITRIKELGQKTWGSNDKERTVRGQSKANSSSSPECRSISQSSSIPDSAAELQNQQQRQKQNQKEQQQLDMMLQRRRELHQQEGTKGNSNGDELGLMQQPQDDIKLESNQQSRARAHARGRNEEQRDVDAERKNETYGKRQRSVHKSKSSHQNDHRRHHHHHRHPVPSSVGELQSRSPDRKQYRAMANDEQLQQPREAGSSAAPSADVNNSINNTTTDNINIVMNNNNANPDNSLRNDNYHHHNNNNNNNNNMSSNNLHMNNVNNNNGMNHNNIDNNLFNMRSNPEDFFAMMAAECAEMQEDGNRSNYSTPTVNLIHPTRSSDSLNTSMPSNPSLPVPFGDLNGRNGSSSDDTAASCDTNQRRVAQSAGNAQVIHNNRFVDDAWMLTGLSPVEDKDYQKDNNNNSMSLPARASDLRQDSDLRRDSNLRAGGQSVTPESDSASPSSTSGTPESDTSATSTSCTPGDTSTSEASKTHTSEMSTSTSEAPSNLRKFDRLYLGMSKKFKHIGLLSARMYPALERHFTSCFSNPALMCFNIFHADTTVRRRPAVYANRQACRLVGIDQTKVYHDIFTESSVNALCKAMKLAVAEGRQDRLTFVPKLWTMVFDEYGNYSQRLFDFWIPQVLFNDQELPILYAPHRIVSQLKEPGTFAGMC